MLGGATALIGVILLGFSGRIFAPGDSAAILRPLAGGLLIPMAVILWFMKTRITAFATMFVAVAALGSIAPGFIASGSNCDDGCLKLYQKNLMSKAWPRHSLANDIIASGAEVVTLQEVSGHNRKFMANLFAHYPVAVFCKSRPYQDVAVLTSLPAVEGTEFCESEIGLAGVQVRDPKGQLIWVLSIHMKWPFPFDQFDQSQAIAERIAGLDGPVLVAGDFNMVPWGASVQRIRQAAGTHILGAFRTTHELGRPLLPLPIDTVLVPQGATGTVELRGYLGSDHRGVLANIALQ